MEEAMTTIMLFGYLLPAADILLLLTAYGFVYRAYRARDDVGKPADYLGSLQAGDSMAQTPSNISVPDWTESRRTA